MGRGGGRNGDADGRGDGVGRMIRPAVSIRILGILNCQIRILER